MTRGWQRCGNGRGIEVAATESLTGLDLYSPSPGAQLQGRATINVFNDQTAGGASVGAGSFGLVTATAE
jgi:hypothetical protein